MTPLRRYTPLMESPKEMLARCGWLFHDGEDSLDLSDKDLAAVRYIYNTFFRMLGILHAAELDCRGYEALHGWVEDACALVEEVTK